MPSTRTSCSTDAFARRCRTAIAEELLLRGADPLLLLGEGSAPPPSWLPHRTVPSYDAYREQVLQAVAAGTSAAILSAAVADYRPRQAQGGKLPSGQSLLSLDLEPTAKVIDLVREAAPALPMVTFKVMHGVEDGALLAEARRRLERFQLVVANHAEEVQGADQSAWLVHGGGAPRHRGKAAIACAIVDWLEVHLASAG